MPYVKTYTYVTDVTDVVGMPYAMPSLEIQLECLADVGKVRGKGGAHERAP